MVRARDFVCKVLSPCKHEGLIRRVVTVLEPIKGSERAEDGEGNGAQRWGTHILKRSELIQQAVSGNTGTYNL